MTRCTLLFDTRRSYRRTYIAVETPFCRRDTARTLTLTTALEGHTGCINSIEFNDSGTLLVTGSDDRTVCLFDTCSWTPRGTLLTSHIRNIFSAAIVPGSGDRTLVSCGLDGRTCIMRVAEGSATLAETEVVTKKILHRHSTLCSKILFAPGHPHDVFVGHGSGSIGIIDLRTEREVDSITLPAGCSSCNALASSPVHPYVIACGTDKPYVMMIDVRKVSRDNPPFLRIGTPQAMQSNGIGGLNFNSKGDRIVCSYKSNDVYAYEWTAVLENADRRNIPTDSYGLQWYQDRDYGSHPVEAPVVRYRGRQNKLTMFKEASYYMNDAFVVTGADCGHIFVWDAASARLLKKIKGDSDIVNGVLTHPALDCIVACGIDNNAKVIRPCDQRHVQESPKHSFSQPEVRRRFRGRLDGEMASDEDGEEEEDEELWDQYADGSGDDSDTEDGDDSDDDSMSMRMEVRQLVCLHIPLLSSPIPEGRDMEEYLKNVMHWLRAGVQVLYGHSDDSEPNDEASDDSDDDDARAPPRTPTSSSSSESSQSENEGVVVESPSDAGSSAASSSSSDDDNLEDASNDELLLKLLSATQRYVEYAEQLTSAVGRMGLIHVQENRLRVGSVRVISLTLQRQTYWRILKYFATISYLAFDGKGILARHRATLEQWSTALVDATILKAAIFAAEGDVEAAMAALSASAAQIPTSVRLVVAMVCLLVESRTSPALLQAKIEALRIMIREKRDTPEVRKRAQRFLAAIDVAPSPNDASANDRSPSSEAAASD